MKTFGGTALFLDRSDINTDEIIPAKYLTAVDKKSLGPHCMEDLTLKGFVPSEIQSRGVRVIVTRANFGCGSSREHAPWALEVNGITAVIAESYARIFRQNMFNCGMPAIELAPGRIAEIFAFADGATADCAVDMIGKTLTFTREDGSKITVGFSLNPFDEALVQAGGWVEYADARY